MYVHESVALADLPPELPIEPVRIQRHSSNQHRNVLWIDAPDIDSTAETNRRAALTWLPHVDLVCYVVSPERYRDDAGWRVLQQRGHKHGWIFVLNRWDEGDPQQAEDFARMLAEAGFDSPVLLRTCCLRVRRLPSADEFDQIQAALATLIQAQGVRELTRLGHQARLTELSGALTKARGRLGDDALWEELEAVSRARWDATAGTILAGAEWSMRVAAGRFATSTGGLLGHVRRGLAVVTRGGSSESTGETVRGAGGVRADGTDSDSRRSGVPEDMAFAGEIWDDWAQSKVTAWLDLVELAARRGGVSSGPLRQRLESETTSTGAVVSRAERDAVRMALAKPGTALGRILRRVTGFLVAFLPAMALVRVAWAVVQGYEAASSAGKPYLGTDFMIHSVLLVLLAWALPFTADRLLRPSLEQMVLRAFRGGLQTGLDEIWRQLADALRRTAAEARAFRGQADELIAESRTVPELRSDAEGAALSRMVIRPQQAGHLSRADSAAASDA